MAEGGIRLGRPIRHVRSMLNRRPVSIQKIREFEPFSPRAPGVSAVMLDTAWDEVDQAWDDDGAHQRLLTLLDAGDCLADGAARYRRAKERDPARAERADKMLSAITARALAKLVAAPRVEALERPRTWVLVFGYVVALALIGLSLYVLSR